MVLLLIYSLAFNVSQLNVDYRKSLDEAFKSKDAATRMHEKISRIANKSALDKAYLGMLEMAFADHAAMPWSKWNHFVTGSKLLDGACLKEPDNLEIIYLRFACQSQTPDFLGYNDFLEQDKKKILAKFDDLSDQDLKERIRKVLKESDHVSVEEKKRL